MAKSRLSMRREAEAAEELEANAPAKKKAAKKTAKKKAAKKKSTTTRTRKKAADTPARRRLVWVVYSSTMREEGRYLYHDREKAEEKLNALLAKGKRRYFIQPIKEPLDSEGNPMVPDEEVPTKAKPVEEAPAVEAEAAAEETEDAPELPPPGDPEAAEE